ncbi:MAG: DUF1810 domain-containing protein [Pseudomonadota bacterium]
MDDDFDEFDLFVEAQDTVWAQVLSELEAGKKTTHWMWFVFPQLASLGQSDMSQLYGIHDLEEATAYLHHPILGSRLIDAARLVHGHADTPADVIMGRVDAMKLRSSMTLFSRVPGSDPIFAHVLGAFWDAPCASTVKETGG